MSILECGKVARNSTLIGLSPDVAGAYVVEACMALQINLVQYFMVESKLNENSLDEYYEDGGNNILRTSGIYDEY